MNVSHKSDSHCLCDGALALVIHLIEKNNEEIVVGNDPCHILGSGLWELHTHGEREGRKEREKERERRFRK